MSGEQEIITALREAKDQEGLSVVAAITGIEESTLQSICESGVIINKEEALILLMHLEEHEDVVQ